MKSYRNLPHSALGSGKESVAFPEKLTNKAILEINSWVGGNQ